jgi:hypothetical protein
MSFSAQDGPSWGPTKALPNLAATVIAMFMASRASPVGGSLVRPARSAFGGPNRCPALAATRRGQLRSET